MKCHKYEIGQEAIIDNPTHKNIEKLKGKKGEIIELHYGSIYDYKILTTENEKIKVKESEINLSKDVIE